MDNPNYYIDNSVLHINQCYCKADFECEHEKIRFYIIDTSYRFDEIRVCRHYFRLRLEEFDDIELMANPKLVKAKTLYSIIKDEIGYFLYEGEKVDFCYMPREATSVFEPKIEKDFQRRKNDGLFDKYVVYIPFYRGCCLRYSVYDMLLFACRESVSENGRIPYLMLKIVLQYLHILINDVRENIPKYRYKELEKHVSRIEESTKDGLHLWLINSVNTLCYYYTNFKKKGK